MENNENEGDEKRKESNVCICYQYTSKCLWLKSKICSLDIYIPIFLEFCNLCLNVGFYYFLTEKLFYYSDGKNIAF